MSRQLALGGQPVVVARWTEALSAVEQHTHLNRLLLVDARSDEGGLVPLLRAAAERGCALVVCLGVGAEAVQGAVDSVCDAPVLAGHLVATSWHDPNGDPDAALDAFSLFTTWVGGTPGVRLLVTEDSGLDVILDAARRLHARASPQPS